MTEEMVWVLAKAIIAVMAAWFVLHTISALVITHQAGRLGQRLMSWEKRR